MTYRRGQVICSGIGQNLKLLKASYSNVRISVCNFRNICNVCNILICANRLVHLHEGDGAGGSAGAGVPGPGPRHHLPHTGQTSKKRNFQDDKLG